MTPISKRYAEQEGLKKIGSISADDMSKVILLLERLKESKKVKYYSMDLILFDSLNHVGSIEISFWR